MMRETVNPRRCLINRGEGNKISSSGAKAPSLLELTGGAEAPPPGALIYEIASRRNLLTLLAGGLLVAGGSAAFAQFQSGSYSATKTDSLERTISTPTSSDGNYSVTSFASVAPKLADGEGRAETESFCAMCHSTRYVTMQPPLPAATWEAEVNKMIKTFGAPIPEATAKKIISYLQAHYAPETRKE